MCSKTCIACCILLLTLSIANGQHAVAAATAAPAAAGPGSTAQLKSIPEDSNAWRREPFKSPEESTHVAPPPAAKQGSTGASTDLALQGILKSSKHYYAIINGRTVKSGDHIEGWTIAEINRYRVTVRRQKEKQIYDIYQGRIDRGTR